MSYYAINPETQDTTAHYPYAEELSCVLVLDLDESLDEWVCYDSVTNKPAAFPCDYNRCPNTVNWEGHCCEPCES